MTIRFTTIPFSRTVLGGLAMAAVAATSLPAAAQSVDESRIRKIEAEVRALQRSVFPGGTGKFFEPEISGNSASPTTTVPNSTTAVTDILVRLDALEAQLQGLTSQTEQNTNSLNLLSTRVAALETPAAPSPFGPSPTTSAPTVTTPTTSTPAANLGAMTGGASSTAQPVQAAPAGPTAARLAAVQEIAKPQTDDPGDDEYTYGFRLWDAGFYPEAQQQLTMFVEKYPTHSRATFGRNLLGRAYLDNGKPKEAAPWFLRNYQSDKQAARAPDSLLYLAEAMIAQKDTSRACIALAEFGDTYPALASGRLADQYQSNLRKVTCN
ncbi:tetratricopeptide repeat protein [Allopontixanthobacter sediminis]|uniref:Tetratricopeptide repeat protein n=1 Tax=Allopontixanthobacter sediminis TaxID=1689985 RepID=A0A845B6E8_9SPHN|nr:tetratricopeptide repeat protein [Allopontixanthobacter sediminis]MXP45052.1 tetratricopeptide repeat protein [Allopontixanthobacter sediminis]